MALYKIALALPFALLLMAQSASGMPYGNDMINACSTQSPCHVYPNGTSTGCPSGCGCIANNYSATGSSGDGPGQCWQNPSS
uniref:Putative evasin n=1 Tax=Amblyomma aureolatum TaxID=187763 RepID=A0A1E1WVZ8_9ACAR